MVRRELLAGLLLLGTSCGPAAATPPSDAGVSGDDAQIVSCKADPRVDTYVARLEKSGATNAVKTQLVAAEPAPPARGRNVWTLTVTDAAGVPMPDVAIKAKPSMPDHAHSADTPTITPMGGGTFRVEGLLFFMGGVWQVQFEVYSSQADQDDGGAPIDRVDYLFCI